MESFFDMHIHTSAGSPDSSLSPDELVSEVQRLGLRGALVTEHNGWPLHDFQEFTRQQDVVLVRALEVSTDMGHIITLGLDGYGARFSSIRELRRVVAKAGGFMIVAHPFRFLFDPAGFYSRNILFEDPHLAPTTAEEAIHHPVFELIDEVEVVNGCNTYAENRFAEEATRLLGRRGTGGSDAHSTQGIGRGVTLFHGDIQSEADLIEALRAGAFTPCEGFNLGRLSYYGEPLV